MSNSLLPDADVIIRLHELGVWNKFKKVHNVLICDAVEKETMFYDLPDGSRIYVRFDQDIREGNIHRATPPSTSDLVELHSRLTKMNASGIDPGETELLAVLLADPSITAACLIDRAAIRAAVLIGLKVRCISVEMALANIRLATKMPSDLTEEQFQNHVSRAETERIQKIDPNSPLG